ncbi:uncharacterized protein LOC122943231 [Bufo gargarizans]|uniref:uncharacterized protein LOC122943231 n=1 Tax=Bufo gargarizans TaxID=30331 RepID=UPI001CF41E21|nr:uncharacterized protein LOC122943231 [Bufo gargarizans]
MYGRNVMNFTQPHMSIKRFFFATLFAGVFTLLLKRGGNPTSSGKRTAECHEVLLIHLLSLTEWCTCITMASGTLSYQQEEISEILSQVQLSGNFLQTPPSEFKARDLERESRRLLNYELHSVTIAEYLKVQRIPRGLRIRTRPTFFKENQEFCEKFEQILNKCSFDLMTLTLSYLHNAISTTKTEIHTIEEQLQDIITPEDYNQLKEKITTSLAQQRKEVETTKRNKFFRDTEDYRHNRVYRWSDTTNNRFNYTNKRSSSRDSAQSGSSGDTNFQYRPDNRQRRSQGRRGQSQSQRGQTNTTTRENSGIVTRSQMN